MCHYLARTRVFLAYITWTNVVPSKHYFYSIRFFKNSMSIASDYHGIYQHLKYGLKTRTRYGIVNHIYLKPDIFAQNQFLTCRIKHSECVMSLTQYHLGFEQQLQRTLYESAQTNYIDFLILFVLNPYIILQLGTCVYRYCVYINVNYLRWKRWS